MDNYQCLIYNWHSPERKRLFQSGRVKRLGWQTNDDTFDGRPVGRSLNLGNGRWDDVEDGRGEGVVRLAVGNKAIESGRGKFAI